AGSTCTSSAERSAPPSSTPCAPSTRARGWRTRFEELTPTPNPSPQGGGESGGVMTDRYTHYKALKFSRPRPRILEVILSRPGKLNALDADGHRELAEVWRDIDRDPETSVALLRGEGGAFSAGGDLGLIEVMTRDWATRTRVWKEASDLVYNVINCT